MSTNTAAARDGMYAAEVVQFMRPEGRPKVIETRLPIATRDAYEAMLAAGCRLEAEVLVTREVSVTITKDEVDVDISVTPNGPEVQAGIAAMLPRKAWEVDS